MMLHFVSTVCFFSFRASFCSHSVLQSDWLPEHQWLWVQPCPCSQLYLFPGISLLFLEWEERDSLLTGGSLQSPDRIFLANTFFFSCDGLWLLFGIFNQAACDLLGLDGATSGSADKALNVECSSWPSASLPDSGTAFPTFQVSNFKTVTLNYWLGP